MIRNYLKTAYRILTRNKVFSFINIIGLSIALTSVLVIFLFVKNELSFDKHFSKFDRIYRIYSHQQKNGKVDYDDATPFPLAQAIKPKLTGHEGITQIYFRDMQLVRVDEEKYNQRGLMFADSSFTDVFDVEFIVGDEDKLKEPNIIYLTEDLAKKYFGSIEESVGKDVVIFDSLSLNVAGVIENPLESTHIPYTALVSFSSLKEKFFSFGYKGWGTRISGFASYVLLKDGVTTNQIEEQIDKIVIEEHTYYDEENPDKFFLQPLSEIHFDERFSSYNGAYILSKKFIWAFISVGLFIIIIAFVNFTNLSIVQTIKRAKEVGIRKVLGADRQKLIKQFLGETFLILLISEVLALILTETALEKVNEILSGRIELQLYGDFSTIVFLIIILVALTFLSGIYPAIVLSKYNPIRALRYKLNFQGRKSFSLYNVLVVIQFVISLVLIVSSIVIFSQISFLKNKDMGFDSENIVNINLPANQGERSQVLAQELLLNPKIHQTSASIGAPLASSNITSSVQYEDDIENDYYANVKTVDSTYHTLFNLNVIAGKWYSNYLVNDSTFNIVVSKSLLRELNIANPNDILDKYIRIFGSVGGIVVGVVDDFHAYSLHREIPPVIFLPLEDFYSELSIKTGNVPYSEIKSFMEEKWNDIFPEYIYRYKIFKESINDRYRNEQRISKIILIFTFIAIVIACLGLYGLVSFMLMQRTKEIGIRKALGASVRGLVLMVSKQFVKLVMVSCIIAWPIAYYIMNKWLQEYAFKIDLKLWMFLLSGLMLLVITFVTIIYQSIKVALTNPVNVLKYE